MKFLNQIIIGIILISLFSCTGRPTVNESINDTILVSDTIQYHPARISKKDSSILPWFSSDKGESYDTVLMLVWNFWKNMETDSNGLNTI